MLKVGGGGGGGVLISQFECKKYANAWLVQS